MSATEIIIILLLSTVGGFAFLATFDAIERHGVRRLAQRLTHTSCPSCGVGFGALARWRLVRSRATHIVGIQLPARPSIQSLARLTRSPLFALTAVWSRSLLDVVFFLFHRTVWRPMDATPNHALPFRQAQGPEFIEGQRTGRELAPACDAIAGPSLSLGRLASSHAHFKTEVHEESLHDSC